MLLLVSCSPRAKGARAVKVGAKVVKPSEPKVVRTIIELKSDFRGIWVRLADDRYPDIWYNTKFLEMPDEDR